MIISLLYDNIRNEIFSCMYIYLSILKEKKCSMNFKALSNLTSNFIISNNLPHKKITYYIFPLNDIQATLPFPPSKCSKNVLNKKTVIFNFTKKVMDFEIF